MINSEYNTPNEVALIKAAQTYNNYIDSLRNAYRERRIEDATLQNQAVSEQLRAVDNASERLKGLYNGVSPHEINARISGQMAPLHNSLNNAINHADNINPNFSRMNNIPSAFDSVANRIDNTGASLADGANAFIGNLNNAADRVRYGIDNTVDFANELIDSGAAARHRTLDDINHVLIPSYADLGNNLMNATNAYMPGYLNNLQSAADTVYNGVIPAYADAANRVFQNFNDNRLGKEMDGISNVLGATNNLYNTAEGIVGNLRDNRDRIENMANGAVNAGRGLINQYRSALNGVQNHQDQVNQNLHNTLNNGMQNLQGMYNDVYNSPQYNDIRNTVTNGASQAVNRTMDAYRNSVNNVRQSPSFNNMREQATELRDKVSPIANGAKNLFNKFRNRGQ